MTVATNVGSPERKLTVAEKKARRQHLKTTKNRPTDVEEGWTSFRAAEKKYKAKWPVPDLSGVLDFGEDDETHHNVGAEHAGIDDIKVASSENKWRGRKDAVEWREIKFTDDAEGTGGNGKGKQAYAFPSVPGLVYLPSYVAPAEQRMLVRWSLKDHARYPNETNLDAHYLLPQEGLWNAYLRAQREGREVEETVQSKASASSSSIPSSATPSVASALTIADQPPPDGPRPLVSNPPASPSLLPILLALPTPPPAPSPNVKPSSPSALIPKLRWANIGWHYHWGNKQYDFSRGKSGGAAKIFADICLGAVRGVQWESVYGDTLAEEVNGEGGLFEEWRAWHEDYEPDAGIVNFYQTRDTLMGHVDRSELCATSPLVSISLGCAAIFLIGGSTRDTEPLPILLRSGDVLIMSGPCRRAYHGVPRILENTSPAHFSSSWSDEDEAESGKEDDWKPYAVYIQSARINVNVRQVFPRGFDPKEHLSA